MALLVGVLVAAVVVGAAAIVAGVEQPAPRYADAAPAAARTTDPLLAEPAVPPGVGMLREFDSARARAWAEGDPQALEALYVAGSEAGRRDVEALASYVDRGLRVEDLATQVLSAELRRDGRRTRVMEVTDQVVGGMVTGDDAEATPLPGDRPTRHVLTWRRVDGRWLLDEVTPA